MKLKQMHLYNFRCFSELSIAFDDQLTVIVAENGAGKTAVLDAIALGLGRYLTRLPGVSGRVAKDTDLRVSNLERQEPFMMLGWKAEVSGKEISWSGGRKRDGSISVSQIERLIKDKYKFLLKHGGKEISDFALNIVKQESEGENVFIPVVAYYGTNRALPPEIKRRRGFKKNFSRFDALSGALEPDSRFKSAFEWFNAMEDLERRERENKRNFDYRLPELQWVRNAIEKMLNGYLAEPRTLVRPLRFVIDKVNADGSRQTLRISQLSDGYKIVLGLVMDLARRMVEANPNPEQFSNVTSPLELPAIVLIDELDLHLHPRWQQQILGDLIRVFPNTQFIVTTHSPQVLTTVAKENIRQLGSDEQGAYARMPPFSPLAHDNSDALAKVMETHSQPSLPLQEVISEYELLVRAGQEESEQAAALLAILVEAGYQFHESDLATWRFLAQRKLAAKGS